MLFLYESFANEAFKSHQLISSASVFAEATLHIRDKLMFFQVPDQSVVDHMLDYFTETACECYRAVVMMSWVMQLPYCGVTPKPVTTTVKQVHGHHLQATCNIRLL